MQLRWQLLAANGLLLVLVVAVAGQAYRQSHETVDVALWVAQTEKGIAEGNALLRTAIDLETDLRGYLLAGNPAFLEPFETGLGAVEDQIASLRSLLADDPTQLARLEAIERAIQEWTQRVAEPAIEQRSADADPVASLERASRFVASREGKRRVDGLRERIRALLARETQLLDQRRLAAIEGARTARRTSLILLALAVGMGLGAVIWIDRRVQTKVGGDPRLIASAAAHVSTGDLERARATLEASNGTGIAAVLGRMIDRLAAVRRSTEDQTWIKEGIAAMRQRIQGDEDPERLASEVLSELVHRLDAHVGAFYVLREEPEPRLSLLAGWAYKRRKSLSNDFGLGEGLVGQAALERQQILVTNVPDAYVRVTSALGESVPNHLCVTPVLHDDHPRGVVEIGTLHELSAVQLTYLEEAVKGVATALEMGESRERMARALQESRDLADELRTSNAELEENTQQLEQQQAELESQTEELRVTNEELERKSQELERQRTSLEERNFEIENARQDLEEQSEALEQASRYKSEFLANMSHELRTPLNSMLILSEQLANNRDGNLSEDQTRSARIIHEGGKDLLALIEDILDLSKVEAGRLALQPGPVEPRGVANELRRSFEAMAVERRVTFETSVDDDVPTLRTDAKRLTQILRNLLGNAFKFTTAGQVRLRVARPAPGTTLRTPGLRAEDTVAFAVEDTGIGIGEDKQEAIFEAFQQVDGSTRRRFGGTGLGLAISRQLARLLGGEIHLESRPGEGSTFTFYTPTELPETASADGGAARGDEGAAHGDEGAARGDEGAATGTPAPARRRSAATPTGNARPAATDERSLLVVEDDPRFAEILAGLGRRHGFEARIVGTGRAALDAVAERVPSAVILDLGLPDMDGLEVLRSLKSARATARVPVHVVSGAGTDAPSLSEGAVEFLAKPVPTERLERLFARLDETTDGGSSRILVVEDDASTQEALHALLRDEPFEIVRASDLEQARARLEEGPVSGVILDLGLGIDDGEDLLRALETADRPAPPVVVYTARELTEEEHRRLAGQVAGIVVKGPDGAERLLDEVRCFLHSVDTRLPARSASSVVTADALGLRGLRVLVVDDDLRNSFALSKVLSDLGMVVRLADDGRMALDELERDPGVDLVLMDVMMPVVDGLEAARAIRAQERFAELPVVALTARAMASDREACLGAGMNDFVSKPVDTDVLVATLRRWLVDAS